MNDILFSLKSHIMHQHLNRFMVEFTTGIPHGCMDPTITVSSFVLFKNFFDLNTDGCIFIRLAGCFMLIVKCASGQSCHFEQIIEWKLMP